MNPSCLVGDRIWNVTIEWRQVPGWPEYEISERGDLRRAQGGQGTREGRPLKPWRNQKTGYLQVALWRGNRQHRATVHRLVALAFLGDPPSPTHVVAHNDGGRDNNHWANLRWATQLENMADTTSHGTHNRGSRNGQSKLDEVCIAAIRKMAAMQIPNRVAAEGFGVCRQTIDDIIARRVLEACAMTRQCLPNRRPNITTELLYEIRSYSVTFGFNVRTDRIAEVFMHGAKVGSAIDRILDDACVALSLLLQHGAEPAKLAASMGRLGDGKSPASIIGALADLIVQESRS